MSIDVARLRKRFPTLAHKNYLNSGSYGLLSLDVKQAFESYLACRDERGSDWGKWAMRDDAVRTRVARRFQAGTPPVPNCYAAAAGLDIILELGMDSIEPYIRQLTGACMERLLEAGCRLATPRDDAHRGPSVCIRSTDDNALVAKLAERNVVTSCRAGNVRATFHCYNDEADVDALISAVVASRNLLQS